MSSYWKDGNEIEHARVFIENSKLYSTCTLNFLGREWESKEILAFCTYDKKHSSFYHSPYELGSNLITVKETSMLYVCFLMGWIVLHGRPYSYKDFKLLSSYCISKTLAQILNLWILSWLMNWILVNLFLKG